MVKCENCPCLQRGFNQYCGELEGEWWFCGVDESDIADGNVFRRDVRVKECPIGEIRFKDGSIFKPEVIADNPDILVGM